MILHFRHKENRKILAHISNDFYRVHAYRAPDFPTLIAFLVEQGYRCKGTATQYDYMIDNELVSVPGTYMEVDDEDIVAFMLKYG
jgi:hypothetical protein